jgi:hypothetical protein
MLKNPPKKIKNKKRVCCLPYTPRLTIPNSFFLYHLFSKHIKYPPRISEYWKKIILTTTYIYFILLLCKKRGRTTIFFLLVNSRELVIGCCKDNSIELIIGCCLQPPLFAMDGRSLYTNKNTNFHISNQKFPKISNPNCTKKNKKKIEK